jgi:protein TonB
MFEDSLFSSAKQTPGPRSRWIAATSIALQAFVVGIILLIPLLHPESLAVVSAAPRVLLMPVPKPPTPPKPQPVHTVTSTSTATPAPAPMQSNRSLLPSIRPNPGTEPDPGTLMVGLGPERMGIGSPIGTAGTSTSSPTVVRAATPTKLRISDGVSAGMLLSPIRPTYPPIAIATRTQGIVVVTATIDKSGRIVGAQAISGPPILRGAAIEAVRLARYRPYLLNGQPTEVDTTISVNFRMD